MSNILYIGSSLEASTSYHRSQALQRIGNLVELVDVRQSLKQNKMSKYFEFVHFRTGYKFLQNEVYQVIFKRISESKGFDIIWVDSGELLGPKILQLLQSFGKPLILYNIDDPTGRRDGNRFRSLIKALPYYDLVVVVRKETQSEVRKLGAKQVLLVLRSYDEVYHHPLPENEVIEERFRSEIAFVGTWMRNEHRDKFLMALVNAELPIAIWGARWEKSKAWPLLKSYYRGNSLGGKDYVAAIQGAKISIGMLSKGNRDLHTTRSMEIPYIGGLLCAERTVEHLSLFVDGAEAVFWDNEKECIEVCRKLLANEPEREKIRLAGMARVRRNHVGNEDICRSILNHLKQL